MSKLIVIPSQWEFDPFIAGISRLGLKTTPGSIGRLPTVDLSEIDVTVAVGGFGKTQFGVQTQYLIDAGGPWQSVVCAGAGGALSGNVSVGDVVVATETIEHDMRFSSGKPVPRFNGSPEIISKLKKLNVPATSFAVHFAPVASGDEDVIDPQRRTELHKETGAAAVAWEGAGGARAAAFSDLPFIEMRGITDLADQKLGDDFMENVPVAMGNIATLVSL